MCESVLQQHHIVLVVFQRSFNGKINAKIVENGCFLFGCSNGYLKKELFKLKKIPPPRRLPDSKLTVIHHCFLFDITMLLVRGFPVLEIDVLG